MSDALRLLQMVVFAALSLSVMAGVRITHSLYALANHRPEWLVGTLVAMFALFPMMVAVPAGRWIDRVGDTQPIRCGAALLFLGALLACFSQAIWLLYLVGVLVGSGFILVLLVTQHVTGHLGTPAQRTANFTWFALAMSVATTISPVLAGFMIEHVSHVAAYRVFAALALLLLLCVLLPMPGQADALDAPDAQQAPEAQEADTAAPPLRGSLRELFWHTPRLRPIYLTVILIASAWDSFMFLTPIVGTRLGFSAATIGLIIGSFSLATFVIRFLMPWITRRFGPWKIIHAVLLITAGCFLLYPWLHQARPLMLLAFVLGLALGASQPNVLSLLFQAAPSGRAGEAVGVRVTLSNASQVGLPLLFGTLGSQLGLLPIFLLMSVLLFGGTYLIRRPAAKN
jgi:MFS family permease